MNRLQKIAMMLLLDLGLSLVGAVALQRYIEGELSKKLDAAIASHADRYSASYRRVKVDLWHQSVQIRGILIEPKGSLNYVQIERFTISGIDFETFKRAATQPGRPTLPKTLHLAFDGLQMSPDLLGAKTAAVLKDFGYEEISLSASSGFLIDRENEALELKDFKFAAKDMGQISASIQLSNFFLPSDSDLAQGSPIDIVELQNSTLKSFTLKFTDASLIGRINYSLAKEGKPSLASMSRSLEQALSRSPATASAFAGTALRKMSEFAANPKTLKLSAQPPATLPLVGIFNVSFFADMDQTAKDLGLSVELEP